MHRHNILALGVAALLAVAGPSLLRGADDDSVTIPSGATITARLNNVLSTRASQQGDPFTARVVEPVIHGGEEVVPAGSTISGHVTFVKPPGRVKGKAEMRLVVDKIRTPQGVVFDLSAALKNVQGGDGTKVKDQEGTIQGPGKDNRGTATQTGIDAGIGAGVGAIAAGGSGALYGLGIGAAVGLIRGIAKKHGDVTLPIGTELDFTVSRTITAPRTAKATASDD